MLKDRKNGITNHIPSHNLNNYIIFNLIVTNKTLLPLFYKAVFLWEKIENFST